MKNLTPYISLETFDHPSLWKENQPIWSALNELKFYLTKMQHKIEIDLPEGVFLKNSEMISIGKGTVIEPGVMIQGPCIIGKNCEIRHGAYIRECVILGDGCRIGHAAEIKHSILLNGAKATHFTYVGDSILGNFVNLGAGVKCANLRLDQAYISVLLETRKVDTGLKKFGAVVGDFSQIGCNSVLNPGTLVGKMSFSLPLVSMQGTYPPKSQVSAKGITPIQQNRLEKFVCK